ncbi:MAG TPA: YncE family protein [Bacteroidia bacterium]|jgi:YVTN family beta-propeller protein|nr:YncE family protein [Bacteroidia bacterium]
MRKAVVFSGFFLLLITIVYSGCRKDVGVVDLGASKYPEKVGTIFLTKCAITGCHNTQSAEASAGLDLTTWENCMKGSRGGAVVIPYSHTYSTCFIFSNTYADLGNSVLPSMPLNSDPLSHEEMVTLRDWIDQGAPNADGFVKWSDNPTRKKYYVTNQSCDVVCSIDPETDLQMRFINVGAEAGTESPHLVKISPDGQYWYCSFIAGKYLEKHRTSDDALVARILLGPDLASAAGSWNTFAITHDGRWAYVIDWSPTGRVARVDLQNNTWVQTWQGSGLFSQPHGSFLSPDDQTLYITSTYGNFIYKVDVSVPQLPSINQVVIDGSPFPVNANIENSHDIVFSPDGTKYFVSCQFSNLVRVMDVATDTLIAAIPVGTFPQEFAISESTPYLYVTCQEDTNVVNQRGSVYVINYQTNTVVTHLYTGWQPHGIAVNDDKGVVIVANRNYTTGGPAPHHSFGCGNRNGNVSFIDMTTNTMIPDGQLELSADPYTCAYRH